ncbi:hypothetical protein LOTGIDRAFT_127570 [Lottia gigantea]|uniref:tRNA (guanine(26)-N(2))-dimethyltransferase n=1 Tax=Lottia gigantea TaxID=225164 RepID=V4BFD1_LOTGI|nr:hypothetical protein LOTGIDRAFT_127570 [Lottia gigantea]ESO87614.1 hypothetical protein LOTGIDRAFT_127570 [Lottia gigantea]
MATVVEKASENNLNFIKEGKAEAFQPKNVFYNPVQEFNRDITIAVINEFAKETIQNKNCKKVENDVDQANVELKVGVKCDNGIKILEGLSASGLRSMRFGLEIAGVKEIVTNDVSKWAVDIIDKNIEHNKLQHLVMSNLGDASMLLYQNKTEKSFDVVDLDPYGSPAQFLDAAVQAVRDGGLLCVTATDMAVLCGNAGEKCAATYGAMSVRMKCCHEEALRILLQCIETHANRYSRYIEPVISLSVDFYVRVFVKIHTGAKKVKESVTKKSMFYHCVGCGTVTLQKLGIKEPTEGNNFKFLPAHGPPVGSSCDHCNSRHVIGGPVWSDPIHSIDFIDRVLTSVSTNLQYLNTSKRISGLLTVAKEELQDIPFYYVLDDLCSTVHCSPLSLEKFNSAILNAGHKVSLSHAARNSKKTDAPSKFIWDIMRTWVKQNPIKDNRRATGSIASIILDKEIQNNISFTPHPQAIPASRNKGLVRFQPNPESNWGPKPRPSLNNEDKQKKFQGKRKHKQNTVDTKQYSCKRFKAGQCELGEECKYSHKLEECSLEDKT